MKRQRRRPATLKDVAEATGFSVNTVSRALRGKDDISEQTRAVILAAAKDLGYVSNMTASSLRLGYTNTIAVILGDISNLHFAIMLREIETRAKSAGYSTFLIDTNEDEDAEEDAVRTALSKNVDGIIICPAQKSERNIDLLTRSGVPFVLVGRRFSGIETDYVVCDDEKGGYLATRKFIEYGHRRIMMVNGPAYISSARERLAGYRRAHAEYDIATDEDLIQEVDVTGNGYGRIVSRFLRKKPRCTAIFAFSDLIAWGLWAEMLRRGIEVPRDVSLIGCDSIRPHIPIPGSLCSVAPGDNRMSHAAVDILLGKARNKPPATCQVVLETTLVEGDTIRRL